jgi:KDO2-lipid IV(A) lauroyltransferase
MHIATTSPLPLSPRRHITFRRMAKPRNDLLDYMQYVGLRVVSMAAHSWGVNVSLALARSVGTIMYFVDKKHRDRAMANLRFSFPEMPEARRRVVARRSMQALCMLAVEVLFTTRLVRIETFSKYVELGGEFGQVLQLMLRRNQGMIMLTGHYSNWEILGYALATIGFPTSSVARPLDNPYLSEFVFGVRERTGQKIIAKKGATTEIIDVLENKGVVGFTADQNAGAKGMFVDFFGRKASAYKSVGLLAMQYEVPVVIGYARRVKDTFRFVCGCQDIIYPEDWKSQDDPLRYITQRYTKAIEDFVRAEPDQYLWVHRRWKTRPKGEVAQKYD